MREGHLIDEGGLSYRRGRGILSMREGYLIDEGGAVIHEGAMGAHIIFLPVPTNNLYK